jgi:hypothetical protein
MSLLDVLRAGVAIADKITKPMQAVVMYERELSADGWGTGTFAAPTPLRALVDFKAVQVRTKDGVLSVTRSTITLLDITEVVAATNGQGIGNNDRFTFPDGDTGPTLDIGGFVDAGTGHPIATTVMIG